MKLLIAIRNSRNLPTGAPLLFKDLPRHFKLPGTAAFKTNPKKQELADTDGDPFASSVMMNNE